MRRESSTNRLVRDCIVSSLIDLMKTTDFDQIRIIDITTHAGVSRMAYYRNYTSKEDILNKYMEQVGDEIHLALRDSIRKQGFPDPMTYFTLLFDYLGRHSDIGIAVIRAKRTDLILENVRKNMQITFPQPKGDAAASYRLDIMVGAFVNVFLEWIKKGKPETSEFMAKIGTEMFRFEYVFSKSFYSM